MTCLQSDTSVTRGASPEAGFLSFPVSAIKYSVSFPRNQGAGPAQAESIYWHRAAVPSDAQSFSHPVYFEQTHPGGSAWWVTGHLSCLSLGLGLPRTHCADSSPQLWELPLPMRLSSSSSSPEWGGSLPGGNYQGAYSSVWLPSLSSSISARAFYMKAARLENTLPAAERLLTQRLGTHSFRKAWRGQREASVR